MDLQVLTKKNQSFIHIATNQLIRDGKSDQEIKALLEEIIPTIIENQKKGLTARSLYGPPSEWAKSYTKKADSDPTPTTNNNPWLMWLDSSLLILGILGAINGLMGFFQSGTKYGVLTFLVIGFGVGAGMYLMYHLIYRNMEKGGKRPKFGKAIFYLILTTLAWSLVFFLAALIPEKINPILSPTATLLIAAIAFGLRHYLKKRWNIRSALQPIQ